MNKKILLLSLLCFSLTSFIPTKATFSGLLPDGVISKLSGNKPTLVAVGTVSLLVGYVAFKMIKQQYRKWMVYREYKSIEKEAQSLYRDILNFRVKLRTAQSRFKKLVKRTSTFYAENKTLIDSTLKQKQKELIKALHIKINNGVQFGLIAIINLLEPILKELK